jgi:hypothetical protein
VEWTYRGDPGRDLIEGLLGVHSETPHSADICRMGMAIARHVIDGPAGAKATLRQINGLDHIRRLLPAACEAALGDSEAAHAHVRTPIAEMPDITLDRIGLFRFFRRPGHGLKLRGAVEKAWLAEG